MSLTSRSSIFMRRARPVASRQVRTALSAGCPIPRSLTRDKAASSSASLGSATVYLPTHGSALLLAAANLEQVADADAEAGKDIAAIKQRLRTELLSSTVQGVDGHPP